MPKILCVIPSRIASTRLPNKPLLLIQDKPMVQWTFENASRCEHFYKVVVATDNHAIAKIIEDLGGTAHMTDPTLLTGSDRVAAVVKDHYPEVDVVVNLQGDEPFIKPNMLTTLIRPYLDGKTPEMTTLAYPLDHATNYHHPGAVKVITNLNQQALYFSRAPIPYFRESYPAPVYHHIGLYAFRRDFLLHYTTLAQTPLELAEGLEQLRALENGYCIEVCLTEQKTLEINTPEELARAQFFEYTD